MGKDQALKAIETVHNGYRFRSRLEARWAVFFDTLGVRYEYEKEGLELQHEPSGRTYRYLPDFWLPEQEMWVEIKGALPNREACIKAELLAIQSHQPVVLFSGPCWPHESDARPVPVIAIVAVSTAMLDENDRLTESWDPCPLNVRWCECPRCGIVGIAVDGNADLLPCGCGRVRGGGLLAPSYGFHNGDWLTPKLMAAYTAARQARFEEGR